MIALRGVLFCLCWVLVLYVGTGTSCAQHPELKVTPEYSNLGAVGHMSQRHISFEVQNTSAAEVQITKVKSSCDCIKVRFERGALGPGEVRKGSLDVRLGRGFGKFDKYIAFHTAKTTRPAKLRVVAAFHPGIRVDARDLVFHGVAGKVVAESTQQAIVTRNVRKAKPLQITEIRVVDPKTKATHPYFNAGASVLTDNEAQILVQLEPEHPVGPVRASLLAKIDGLDLVIPIRGTVHKGIRPIPVHFNFSRIDDPATATKLVDLIPVDGKPFEIKGIRVEASARSVADAIVVDHQTRMEKDGGYRLTARITDPKLSPGSRVSGKVFIDTTHPDCPVIEIQYLGFVPQPRRTPPRVPPRQPRPKGE